MLSRKGLFSFTVKVFPSTLKSGCLSNGGEISVCAKPVAFRAVPVIKVKEITPVVHPKLPAQLQPETKLIIEKDVAEKPASPGDKPRMTETNGQAKTSLGSLDRIRQKVSDQHRSNGTTVKELTAEELSVSWGAFIEKLVIKKNHSAVTNFKMATLKIIDNNSIEIITDNNIQQKFIEQERATLVDHLQQHFCNKQLTYAVMMVENITDDQPAVKVLNTKEQYLKIIEEYPLVKELKDRLRLELDY